jgi:superfamily II DNA or RNA helicase
MQALFDAVCQACSPHAWSRGVEFTRANAVLSERADDEEVVLKVMVQDTAVQPTVTLWPDDEDWSCDCGHHEAVCAHVAAAVIAFRRAGQEGRPLPAAQQANGKLRYALARSQGALTFERYVVHDGREQLLESPLSLSLTRPGGLLFQGRVSIAVAATPADLAVESALGIHRRGRLPREAMGKLLTALAHCPDVRLDGNPVKTLPQPIGLQVCLEDQGDGFRLFVEHHSAITEVFSNGVALCNDTLRPVADPGLTASERADFAVGRHFTRDQLTELLGDILPSLEKRLPVQVRTQRLPQVVQEPPRIVLDVHREGDALTVLPTLVYGQPPLARVDADRLVHLQGPLPKRNEYAEERLVWQLRDMRLAPGHKAQYTGAAAVRVATRLKAWRGEIRGSGHTAFELAPPLVPQGRLDFHDFEMWFESAPPVPGGPVRRVDGATVLRAWQSGESLVPLSGGGWAPLPSEWLEQFGHHVAELLAARNGNGTLPSFALPDLARLCESLAQPSPPEFDALRVLVENFAGIPEAPLPDDVQATLRSYQRSGVNWLIFIRQAGLGGMLADDMGLGKTLQALCAVRGRTLVVAPTSVLSHWDDEIRRFRPGLRHSLYHGPQRQLDAAADVTLTTYAILRLDGRRLAQQHWDTVVLDEAQNIKNPDSQVAQAAFDLRAAFRLTLSGTPIENRLDELWSQFHFLNRGLLGGRQDFQDRYAQPIAGGQPQAAERLRERIRPFILRRSKGEVAPELPPRTERVLYCELSDAERVVYDTVRAATLNDVVARLEAGGNVMVAFEALLRLRQASCHSGLVPGRNATTSAKVELLLEVLTEALADRHKALVFSQWTALLDRVEPHLRAADIDFARLDGQTRRREEVVRRFQDDDGPPVMLISLRAGGTGLNLTAADHIFLLDPWWNPAVEDQAADRAHRIGQTRPVLVHRLVARDTVEERILALQQHKRALADVALANATDAAAITRTDLLALLA